MMLQCGFFFKYRGIKRFRVEPESNKSASTTMYSLSNGSSSTQIRSLTRGQLEKIQ